MGALARVETRRCLEAELKPHDTLELALPADIADQTPIQVHVPLARHLS
jgi:hypothetical protein